MMYANTVSNLFGSSSTFSLDFRSIWGYCDGGYLHLLCFFNRMKHLVFIVFFNILINCCIVKMLYAVLVIKNKLYGCFMKKPYIFSCTAHVTTKHSMDQKVLQRHHAAHGSCSYIHCQTKFFGRF